MEIVEILALLRIVLAISAGLGDAIATIQAGGELSAEQQDAITKARKLAVSNVDSAVDEAIRKAGGA